MLTSGQAHDLTCAEQLIDSGNPDALLGDKACDADPLIDTKLKHFRAIATRYDKLGKIFLAGVQLAPAIILLN